mgnify:CR=1 FL=1
MNIEELAFENRKTLANLNAVDLLNIIEFLQDDRRQCLEELSKTHNRSVEIQKKNQELKSQLKGTTHCFDEEEHEILKKQLREASLTIQEMVEQDIECPSNCEKLRELKKQLEEKENIACDWKDSCLENAGKIEILETQQKKFIKYLEDEITNTVSRKEQLRNKEAILVLEVRISEYNIILQKYKEIVNGSKQN